MMIMRGLSVLEGLLGEVGAGTSVGERFIDIYPGIWELSEGMELQYFFC